MRPEMVGARLEESSNPEMQVLGKRVFVEFFGENACFLTAMVVSRA